MVGSEDGTTRGESAQRGEEVGLADVEGVAERGGRLRASRDEGESLEDTRVERIGHVLVGRRAILQREMRQLARYEAHAERRGRGRASMLRDEKAVLASTGQVQGRVGPGREIARAAELLSGMCGGRLAHVVDEQYGDRELALKRPQRPEERGDFLRAVLVDARDAHQRIEDEERGLVRGDGAAQPAELERVVEAQLGDVEE